MAPTQRITRLQWLAWAVIAIGTIVQAVVPNQVPQTVSLCFMTTGFTWFITWASIQSVLCSGRIWTSFLKAWSLSHGVLLVLTAGHLLNLWFQGRTTRLSSWVDHWTVISGVSFGTTISLLATMFLVGGWKLFRIRLRDRVTGDPVTPAKVSLIDLMLLTAAVAIHITVYRLQHKWIFEPNTGFLGPGFAFFVVLTVCLSVGFMGWWVVLLPSWVSMARHWSVLRRRIVWTAFYLAWLVLAAIAWIGNWTEPDFWITFLVGAGWIVCNLLLVHWLVVKHPTFIGLEWYRLPKTVSHKTSSQ
ncbi:putative transmembrane protein [Rhodopirellula islandica]|uniref:Transmembrane protein n=1 Tax=Rhodopirellula islandica TaxID=595434 RepID=A0A0J1BEG8_RHOIS|nr:hypothetical protein [Rhodopirellula islandica]KLU04916.1 putative transmembrane protein [Rhodopirellula islandica]